ncbi:hypothetical protein EDB89DRAFT_239742 [Lactarius sanguifluus]|nr:hypothetical protein EDB89DRAFT_239742 [Lactarius sanguifluus]
MRGCLKHHSHSPSPSPSPSNSSSMATPPPTRGSTPLLIPVDAPSLSRRRHPDQSLTDACLTRRCVHFCSELVNKVFVADEWDRSPADITPRLTYQDMLELKEIRRSLPHAPQPLPDPDLPELDARGVPRTHFLNTVPVGLVPLIGPDTSTSPNLATPPSVMYKPKIEPPTSLPSRPPPSPPSTPPPNVLTTPSSSQNLDPPKPPSPRPSTVEPWVPPPPPPRLPYNIPVQPRPVPRFNFLPLLESPTLPVPSVSLHSNCPSRQESLPPSSSPSPVPPPPPSIANIAPDHTPSPPISSFVESSHGVGSTDSSRSPSVGVYTANTSTKSSRLTRLDRFINTSTVPLLPPSPLSSTPSPGDVKESAYEDTTCLEAELSRLWRNQSCLIDGEAETEESEAESSVVHTEAESDGESTRSVAAFGGATKVSRTPVAVVTAADDDDEGEMSLIELESGVMAFVRVPRRR